MALVQHRLFACVFLSGRQLFIILQNPRAGDHAILSTFSGRQRELDGAAQLERCITVEVTSCHAHHRVHDALRNLVRQTIVIRDGEPLERCSNVILVWMPELRLPVVLFRLANFVW